MEGESVGYRNLFAEELKRVLNVFSPRVGGGDEWIWILEQEGSYLVNLLTLFFLSGK